MNPGPLALHATALTPYPWLLKLYCIVSDDLCRMQMVLRDTIKSSLDKNGSGIGLWLGSATKKPVLKLKSIFKELFSRERLWRPSTFSMGCAYARRWGKNSARSLTLKGTSKSPILYFPPLSLSHSLSLFLSLFTAKTFEKERGGMGTKEVICMLERGFIVRTHLRLGYLAPKVREG